MMTPQQWTFWIQAASSVAAVAAAIIALVVSAKDRKNARLIAAADRTEALKQNQLIFERDLTMKLLVNALTGGSTDPLERAQLGAERSALIGTLGPERVPKQWARTVNANDDRLREMMTEPKFADLDWKKDQFESQLAMNAILREIRDHIAGSQER